MNQRTQIVITVVVVLLVATVSFLVWQERDPSSPAPISEMLGLRKAPSIFENDVTEWTPLIRRKIEAEEWDVLARDLARLSEEQPEVYRNEFLDYLHARALIETGDLDEAEQLLEPYLEPASDFRVLALRHAERIAQERNDHSRASELRRELIRQFPDSYWREGAVEREIEALEDDPEALLSFSESFGAELPEHLQREVRSRAVGALFELKREQEAIDLGLRLLNSKVSDDAAERVWRTLDRPSLTSRYSPAQLYLLAMTAHNHRHFTRAAEILSQIETKIPGKADDIRFAIGRAFFWNEQFAEAEAAYIRAAGLTSNRNQKARLYYHAARTALLQSKDAAAEKYLTQSIAVPGRFEATAVSLVQRMRLRLTQDRWSDASDDVQLLRRLFPAGESIVEASIGYAVAAVAAGDGRQALATLGRIRRASTDGYDRSEIAYWRGRAFEASDPLSALDEYLDVLRSEVPSHYKWFVRERLQQPAIQREIQAAVERRRPRIQSAIDDGKWEVARALQTDVVSMRPGDEQEIERLRSIYEQISSYSRILKLQPKPLPTLPLSGIGQTSSGASPSTDDRQVTRSDRDRGEILLALGLGDEAVDRIPTLYPLRPASSALTQSKAHRLADATKPSIYAIEVMMGSVPDDFEFELLPREVRELLYPPYYEDLILEKSKEHGADPTLVRSIMREESRFDARAKSFAAARGLLQFIISTAREIGASIGLTEIESSDLYEPETIIDLGAKYVADLLEQFDGNRYRAAAAYNAGPNQAALWSRLAPSEGDEYFFAAINFDETRHYVRKVLNSYRRYESMERPDGTRREKSDDGTDRADSSRPDQRNEGARSN